MHRDGVAIGAMTSAGNELRHVWLTVLAKDLTMLLIAV